jgi:hypothetical protein
MNLPHGQFGPGWSRGQTYAVSIRLDDCAERFVDDLPDDRREPLCAFRCCVRFRSSKAQLSQTQRLMQAENGLQLVCEQADSQQLAD